MNIITLVEPAVEPLTLEEMYEHLHLDTDGSPPTHPHDTMLASQIQMAREMAEKATRRMFVERRLRLVLPYFPKMNVLFGGYGVWGDNDDYVSRPAYIELPNPPLRAVNLIEYYDLDNNLQTFSSSKYFVSTNTFVPRIEVNEGEVWPSTYRRGDAVLVDYTVGYEPSGSPADDYRANIPKTLKEAMKLIVQLQYDNLPPDDRVIMKQAIDSMLLSYTVPRA